MTVFGNPEYPDLTAFFRHQQDMNNLTQSTANLTPQTLTDTSGGASPDYIANLATKQTDTPDLHSDALAMVKKLMGSGGGT